MSDAPPNNDLFPFHREFDATIIVPPTSAHGITPYSPETACTMSHPSKEPRIDQLFHAPRPPPAATCPYRLPGADPESTDVLIKCLSQNHNLWHIFFNYKRFHNHIVHHLLALWAMGAAGEVLVGTYGIDYVYQRPAFESPNHITHATVYKHIGDERYYSAFLRFFTTEVLKKGFANCLEEYVFSPSANFGNEGGGEDPMMLSCFMGGVFHPFIHAGYAAEFGLAGVAAEALAQAAVHPTSPGLVDKPWFSDYSSKLSGGTRSALTILSLVAYDPRFANVRSAGGVGILAGGMGQYGHVLREYLQTWKLDVESDAGIASAIEELSWMNSLVYGVGGHLSPETFKANFFLMHLLTSSLFLPSLLAILSKTSRRMLLESYFTSSLIFYIDQHRPKLDVPAFYKATEHVLHKTPGPTTSPARGTLPDPSSDLAQTPNTWLPLLQSTLVHPVDHLSKVQRTLSHYSSVYGRRRKGWVRSSSAPEDKKAEDEIGLGELDGTLFLRIAILTQNRLGWMREGEPKGNWDF